MVNTTAVKAVSGTARRSAIASGAIATLLASSLGLAGCAPKTESATSAKAASATASSGTSGSTGKSSGAQGATTTTTTTTTPQNSDASSKAAVQLPQPASAADSTAIGVVSNGTTQATQKKTTPEGLDADALPAINQGFFGFEILQPRNEGGDLFLAGAPTSQVKAADGQALLVPSANTLNLVGLDTTANLIAQPITAPVKNPGEIIAEPAPIKTPVPIDAEPVAPVKPVKPEPEPEPTPEPEPAPAPKLIEFFDEAAYNRAVDVWKVNLEAMQNLSNHAHTAYDQSVSTRDAKNKAVADLEAALKAEQDSLTALKTRQQNADPAAVAALTDKVNQLQAALDSARTNLATADTDAKDAHDRFVSAETTHSDAKTALDSADAAQKAAQAVYDAATGASGLTLEQKKALVPDAIMQRVNEYRAANGLHPLAANPAANKATHDWVGSMISKQSTTREVGVYKEELPWGGSCKDLSVDQCADSIVDSMLASEDSRKKLLAADVTHISAGFADTSVDSSEAMAAIDFYAEHKQADGKVTYIGTAISGREASADYLPEGAKVLGAAAKDMPKDPTVSENPYAGLDDAAKAEVTHSYAGLATGVDPSAKPLDADAAKAKLDAANADLAAKQAAEKDAQTALDTAKAADDEAAKKDAAAKDAATAAETSLTEAKALLDQVSADAAASDQLAADIAAQEKKVADLQASLNTAKDEAAAAETDVADKKALRDSADEAVAKVKAGEPTRAQFTKLIREVPGSTTEGATPAGAVPAAASAEAV